MTVPPNPDTRVRLPNAELASTLMRTAQSRNEGGLMMTAHGPRPVKLRVTLGVEQAAKPEAQPQEQR